MSNLAKLEFAALDILANNYLAWVLDAEIHLDVKGLGDTIVNGKKASNQDKAKAMIFLRHHLHEGLKAEYLTVKNPLELWNNLKERYDHQKTVILPKARYAWMHLRLQDFKTVHEYNSEIFKITSQLKLCGEKIIDEDLLEKTFSTFHAFNVFLQQQYREKGFKKYSELISYLLVAEQNNELLMKNHAIRPTGSAPFPEVNVAMHNNSDRGCGRSRGRGLDWGRGRGRYSYRGRGSTSFKYQRKINNEGQARGGQYNNPSKAMENVCYRCGMKGHWGRTCRTLEHLVKLYQASLKKKGKNIEANFTSRSDQIVANSSKKDEGFHYDAEVNHTYKDDDLYGLNDITHLDVADFLENPEVKE